ncbi:hypothetical protein OKW11_005977 [Pseudomonas baetica]|nr:hypothetical protein [Pseudomonas baetica]
MNGNEFVPRCSSCKASSMEHRCFSHAPGTKTFKRNGWYCASCGTGPQHLVPVVPARADGGAANDPRPI